MKSMLKAEQIMPVMNYFNSNGKYILNMLNDMLSDAIFVLKTRCEVIACESHNKFRFYYW